MHQPRARYITGGQVKRPELLQVHIGAGHLGFKKLKSRPAIPFRKLRNPMDEPKGHTKAWLPAKSTPRFVLWTWKGSPSYPCQVQLQSFPTSLGQRSRKTPWNTRSKKEAGRGSWLGLCSDCIHTETRGSLHWTK